MSLKEITSGEDFFPVSMEENSHEARTEGFRQEEADQNEDLSQELMQFLEFQPGIEIPWAEIDMTSSEPAPIPQRKESSDAKIDDGFLMLEELDRNELFPELNQFLPFDEDELQIQCTETMKNKQDPSPEPSSRENKDLNLKEKIDLVNEELERKSSAPSKSGSNNIKKPDYSGKCCECNKVYLQISQHSSYKHNGKLEKCITSGCKKYFASAQKRIEHEQQEHQERKEFRCQFCRYSAEQKDNLKKHVLRKHSEKKIRCGQKKCGKMFASKADLNNHVKKYHKMVKCPTCGREMSHHGLYDHNRYGRCPGKVAE